MTPLPIIKRELEKRVGNFSLTATLLIINLSLFIISLSGTFGLIGAMRARGNANYESLINVFILVLFTVFIIVMLMAPMYTASLISGERERNTFDTLLSTRLSIKDIVIEKSIAAFSIMGVTIISVIPPLMIPLIFGGIKAGVFAELLIILVIESLLALSIGMLLSAYSLTTIKSVALSLAVLLGIIILPLIIVGLGSMFMTDTAAITPILVIDPLYTLLLPLIRSIKGTELIDKICLSLGLFATDKSLIICEISGMLIYIFVSILCIYFTIRKVKIGLIPTYRKERLIK